MVQLRGSPILHIAQSLFGQMRAFGILANHSTRASEVLNSAILPRLAFLKMLLAALDHIDPEASREPIASGDPIIYNTLDWPPTAPPAGVFEPSGNVSLERHLNSWYLSWNLQLGESPQSAMILKVVRAALWLVKSPGGIDAAIQYVIDLQIKGVIVDRLVAIQAMIWLLRARRCVHDDSDLADFFLEHAPSSASEWTRAQFKEFNLDKPAVRPELTDDLSLLLDRAESEIDQVLSADSYDAWLLGQMALHPMLSTVVSVFHEFQVQDELQFVTKLTRLEEIRADAGGFGRLFRIWSGQFLTFKYTSDFTMCATACCLLSGKTADWKDRMLDERALVPTCLQHLVTEFGIREHPLPDGWARISETLAPIAGPTLLRDDAYMFSRVELFQPDEIENAPSLAEFLESIGSSRDLAMKNAVIQLLCKQAPSRNGQITFSESSSEEIGDIERLEAISAQYNQKYAQIGSEDMSREAVDLFRAVGKFDPDEAESALRGLYRSICADEIDDFINRAFEQGKAGSARECFDRLCYLYPYFHSGQAERAVRLDEDGQTHAALNCMLRAIILEPREATRWHSLGVILKKLGRNDDAILAYGLAKIVHDEEAKSTQR
ncbi:hypothetical protein AAFX91_13295 [Bradyrhizobium sp. 31Argb]|uniref:tetratricopeptide repeat protein n=1 Tax=Bradyrhizobium sp. 31Argb TaxID=3141247 RepID=UPI00374A3073